MGISCFVLFRENEIIAISDLLDKVKYICEKQNLLLGHIRVGEKNDKNKLIYFSANVSDLPFEESASRQLILDFYALEHRDSIVEFSFDDKDFVFWGGIMIDNLPKNEDLLFQIVYSLLQFYSTAKLWVESDWLYTLSDLEKISDKPFDELWCYKNPATSDHQITSK